MKESENPYLTGRREWMERYGSLIAQVRRWQLTGIASLVVAGIAVIGAVTLAHRHQYVPYLIELEPAGAVRQSSILVAGVEMKPAYYKSHLAQWIQLVRSVWTDGAAQKMAVQKVFASLQRRDQAFLFVSNFCQDNWKRASRENVSVEIIGEPLPITDKSWQVEWREIVRSAIGEELRSEEWKATLEIYTVRHSSRETLLANPLGIYVRSVDWTRQKVVRH